MKRIIHVFFLMAVTCTLYSTPVSGLYFGTKWMEACASDYSEDEAYAFKLGVLFPNISYMNVPLRFEPEEVPTLEEIRSASTPFESGRLLYYYLSDVRSEVLKRTALCESFEGIPEEGRELLVKMLEDHYYFDEVDKPALTSLLSESLDDEEDAGVPAHQLRTWHRVIGQYFSMNAFSILLKLKQFNMGVFGVSRETIAEWAREFPSLIESIEFQSYIAELESEFDARFTGCK